MIRLAVELPGGRSYPVLVGPGAIGELASVVPPGARRVAVVTQASVPVEVDPGVEHRVFRIGDGEMAKSLSTVEELCSAFAGWGLTRADVVVGVGGGVVTDVAGFAAASYHRGLPVVHVATTLLAQIDAAIGGKTGVNLPEGKNLVGAFWQPAAVLCDTTVLETLPEREMACGLGEMAKYHFLGGDDLGGGDLGGGGTAADDGPGLTLEQRVARCVQIKAEVVAADEREAGRRAVLNYGHTLGHALETTGRYDLRHGEAVAIGLVYAAELARSLGRIDDERVAEHRRVVDGYGLSGSLPAGADPDELMAAMGRDKKASDGRTFVLDGPDGVEVVSMIQRTSGSIGASSSSGAFGRKRSAQFRRASSSSSGLNSGSFISPRDFTVRMAISREAMYSASVCTVLLSPPIAGSTASIPSTRSRCASWSCRSRFSTTSVSTGSRNGSSIVLFETTVKLPSIAFGKTQLPCRVANGTTNWVALFFKLKKRPQNSSTMFRNGFRFHSAYSSQIAESYTQIILYPKLGYSILIKGTMPQIEVQAAIEKSGKN